MKLCRGIEVRERMISVSFESEGRCPEQYREGELEIANARAGSGNPIVLMAGHIQHSEVQITP